MYCMYAMNLSYHLLNKERKKEKDPRGIDEFSCAAAGWGFCQGCRVVENMKTYAMNHNAQHEQSGPRDIAAAG
jgi:hypothetical protein